MTRASIAVTLMAIGTAVVALTIMPDTGTVLDALLIAATALTVLLWFVGGRVLVGRLEANAWGIRCTTPFATIRLPWNEVWSLEGPGSSTFSQRIVAVSKDGRRRMLWVFDPRVPVSRDGARILVAELEGVRQLATLPPPP